MNRSMKMLLAFMLVVCLSVGLMLSACGNKDSQETTKAPVVTAPNIAPTAPVTQPPVTEPPTEPEPTETIPEDFEWTGFYAYCFKQGVEDFSGEIDGVQFQGLKMSAAATATLTKPAVKSLRLYAREYGFDGLRVHTYVNQEDGDFSVAGVKMDHDKWSSTDIYLGNLNSLTQFSSNATGDMEVYIWFEFINMPPISAISFWGEIKPFKGTVGGITFDGYVFRSAQYQPEAGFTEDAIKAIKAYAEATGYNALRVSAYPIQKDNAYILGGYPCALDRWTTQDFKISSLTTEFSMWSQSQGLTENYMIFEFVNSSNAKTAYGKSGPPVPSSPYFTSKTHLAVESFKGTVADVTFEGYKFTTAVYQPYFNFTDKAVSKANEIMKETGKNFVRVHIYPILLDNGFVFNGVFCPNKAWSAVDIPVDQISTTTQIWSQSQGTTEVYMWFEMYRMDIPDAIGPINASFFESSKHTHEDRNYIVGFSNFKGEAGDTVINGVKITSSDYQPYFKFTAEGVEQIKAFAAENGYNFLTLNIYAILRDNAFLVNGSVVGISQWTQVRVSLESLSDSFVFWSQSQGATEIYMWFEWEYLDVPPKGIVNPSFFEASRKADSTQKYNLRFSDYLGEIGGRYVNGIEVHSTDYQPYFQFSQSGVDALKAYAAANNVDTLRLYAYADLADNVFGINNELSVGKEWKYIDLNINSLTTDPIFWSQSQGASRIYMYFEMLKGEIPSPSTFIGNGFSFENYTGTVGDQEITGLKGISAKPQSHFTFSNYGISQIKAYAAANGYNTLRVHAYSQMETGNLVINNEISLNGEWKYIDLDIASLSKEVDFWSQSEGATEVYLTFEFLTTDLLAPFCFTGEDVSVEAFEGLLGETEFKGLKITSSAAQPKFFFSNTGVLRLKAYAEQNGFDTMTIYTISVGEYDLILNADSEKAKVMAAAAGYRTMIHLDDMTTEYAFQSTAEAGTEVYLLVEFSKEELISPAAMGGTGVDFQNFQGTVGEQEITGLKITSTAAQPHFYFNENAIKRIQKCAEANDVNYIRINVFTNLEDGTLKIGEQDIENGVWTSIEIKVEKLTAELDFWSQSLGTTEIYMTFEFFFKDLINPDCFNTGAQAFTVEDFAGVVGEQEIKGLKFTGNGRMRSNFTQEALDEIKAFAAANGYTEMKVQIYVTVENNSFTLFGNALTMGQWNEVTIALDSLTTSSRFQTTCTGLSEAYVVVSFQ